MKTFEDFLQAEHFKEYHGCKDDYDDAFDNWLGNLDTNEMLEYGEKAILEAQKEAIKAVRLKKKIIRVSSKIKKMPKTCKERWNEIAKMQEEIELLHMKVAYNQAIYDTEKKAQEFLNLK